MDHQLEKQPDKVSPNPLQAKAEPGNTLPPPPFQLKAGGQSESAPMQLKLDVKNPGGMIPNPSGKGVVQTIGQTVQNYLGQLTPEAKALVDGKSGVVSIGNKDLYKTAVMPKGFVGPPAQNSMLGKHPVATQSLMHMVDSAHQWTIEVDDATWPHTQFDDHGKSEKPGVGTGGIVTAPSPNDTEAWGAVTESGKFEDIPPYLVLGHELFGHALMGDKGEHEADHGALRGRGGHAQTVELENQLRDEQGIERRGTFRAPYGGESFFHDKSTPAAAGKVTMSSKYKKHQAWRQEYNKLNGTSYGPADTIPETKGEKLPKNTVIDGKVIP